MPLSPRQWHDRFSRQARWTLDLRRYLYDRIQIERARRVFDLGCGTGVLAAELPQVTRAQIHGLDISRIHLSLAAAHAPEAHLVQGDAHSLPYAAACFDVSLCHFVLLWVADPQRVVAEMARVTRPGGAVLAIAEPDYGARIDYPPELAQIGEWQQSALRTQGADPSLGRRLAGLFADARLGPVESGLLGAQWKGSPALEDWESEWAVIESDLKMASEFLSEEFSEAISDLKQRDREAWSEWKRVLFVPTFYAWGRVPG